MSVQTDLVVPGDAWVDAQAILAGDPPPSGDTVRLEELGLTFAGSLTPEGKRLLEGYLSATHALRVRLVSPGDNRELMAWMGRGRVGLLDMTLGEDVHLARTEPGMFPLRLVSLLDLGPRPLPLLMAPQDMAGTGVLDLLEGDPSALEALADELRPIWPEIGRAMAEGAWQSWTVESFLLAGGETAVTGVCAVLDTAGGALGIDVAGEIATFTPVSSTDVWMRLAGLLAPWC